MASASGLLSEEQFLCSICLDVFSQPVTTPCGHNFCKACITMHWDSSDQYHCPMCKEKFHRRPELRINCFISEMADTFRKSVQVKAASSREPQNPARPVEMVPCDVCAGAKLKALKSCVVCLTSYCETHLEPHHRAPALKKHQLIDPVGNLEDRACKEHDKTLELFCRSDQVCICIVCSQTSHKSHDTVLLKEEFGKRQKQVGEKTRGLQQIIQARQLKVQEIKRSAELNKRDAEKEIADTVEVLTALEASVRRNRVKLIGVIEEKQRAAENEAEGLIVNLEQEITELQRRSTELEQLSQSEDHLHFLQSFPPLSTPPHTKDLSKTSVRSHLCVGNVRSAVAILEETLNEKMEMLLKYMEMINEDLDKLPEDLKLNRIQQRYAVDVTLDPDTANPSLTLSADRKEVVYTGGGYTVDGTKPKRFDNHMSVFGKDGFSSGRSYYEVQVEGNTHWFLGVARESINRKEFLTTNPENGYWHVSLDPKLGYIAATHIPLSLIKKPQRVGVFVDYEEGEVSFYDVEARALVYTFTVCAFTEKLYPFFSSGCKDSRPLVISPVTPKY